MKRPRTAVLGFLAVLLLAAGIIAYDQQGARQSQSSGESAAGAPAAVPTGSGDGSGFGGLK